MEIMATNVRKAKPERHIRSHVWPGFNPNNTIHPNIDVDSRE
jgi:hypothetical protein